ncbi:MAG: alpha/beta fold hydrolase [Acidimicrobiales bacterium]
MTPTRRPAPGGRRVAPAGRRALLAALGLVVAMAGCSGDQADGSTETTGPFDPTGPDAAAWAPCPEGPAECARLTVPLDHAAPDGPTVELALARIPATGDRRGSLVVNFGGPGVPGAKVLAGGGFRVDQAVAEHFDLVAWDPRGTGASTGLACATDRAEGPLPDTSPDDPAEAAALDRYHAELTEGCGATNHDLLRSLAPPTMADDLDAVRAVLGDDRLNYYGFSYGTIVGHWYAARYPDRVGHLVFDAVADATNGLDDLLRQQATGFETAFYELDRWCATSDACAVTDLAGTYDRVMIGLETRSVDAGAVADPGPSGAAVGPNELESATLLALSRDGSWPRYSQALADADAGDWSDLADMADASLTAVPFTPYLATSCVDGAHPVGAEAWDAFADELAGIAPRLGPAVANEVRACASWPVGPVEDPPGPLPQATPVLVISAAQDPATPLENARRLAGAFGPAGHLITVDGLHHTSYGTSRCVRDRVSAYLVDDDPGPVDARC